MKDLYYVCIDRYLRVGEGPVPDEDHLGKQLAIAAGLLAHLEVEQNELLKHVVLERHDGLEDGHGDPGHVVPIHGELDRLLHRLQPLRGGAVLELALDVGRTERLCFVRVDE